MLFLCPRLANVFFREGLNWGEALSAFCPYPRMSFPLGSYRYQEGRVEQEGQDKRFL